MRGTTRNPTRPGRMPLFLAVALHLGIFIFALAAPHLVPEPIHPPEIYRVELFNSAEFPAAPAPSLPAPADLQPAPQPAAMVTPTPHQPPVKSKPVSPPIKTAPPAKPLSKPLAPPRVKGEGQPGVKPETVSLTPLRERLLAETRAREEQELRNRELSEKMAQLKLDLKRQKADIEAHDAATKALKAIANYYQMTQKNKPSSQVNHPANPTGQSNGTILPAKATNNSFDLNAVKAAYGKRIKDHISPHWVLPEHQDWDKKLSATIVIRIKKDGSVATSPWFDHNSGNSRFDQQVKKAVTNSLPLPPLPPELGENSEEIGVTFTPGGLK